MTTWFYVAVGVALLCLIIIVRCLWLAGYNKGKLDEYRRTHPINWME